MRSDRQGTSDAAWLSRPRRWWPRRWLACIVVIALVLGGSGCSADRANLGRDLARSLPKPAAALREVPPPLAVQQLQAALAERQPAVEILSPRNGTTLPDGPWTLRLGVQDWPLVDAGSLGPGPHLAVQIDDGPPLRLTDPDDLSLTLPSLTPGSHRITAYAARPWGEAVKSPGAQSQIVVHRVAANPLGVPAAGSPQLILTSPGGSVAAEPLLLDWLLLDAPLQHLRANDESWRLRVTVNGDSFLVDRQEPLWLQGWKRGSNALVLELVDGRGEPLNPPFNTLVQEVRLQSGPAPVWLGGRLDPLTLDQLLGLAPPPADPEEESPVPEVPAPAPATLSSEPAAVELPAAMQQPAAEAAQVPPAITQAAPGTQQPLEDPKDAENEAESPDSDTAEGASTEPELPAIETALSPESALPAAEPAEPEQEGEGLPEAIPVAPLNADIPEPESQTTAEPLGAPPEEGSESAVADAADPGDPNALAQDEPLPETAEAKEQPPSPTAREADQPTDMSPSRQALQRLKQLKFRLPRRGTEAAEQPS
ncbi:MAG: hypothetical protein ACOVNL_02200 [Prochlorococcaceae cyanobacterium]